MKQLLVVIALCGTLAGSALSQSRAGLPRPTEPVECGATCEAVYGAQEALCDYLYPDDGSAYLDCVFAASDELSACMADCE